MWGRTLSLASCVLFSVAASAQGWSLTIVHSNDLHSHIEQTTTGGRKLGGYARHVSLINQIRSENENVLLVNAGDTFQGTIFFNTYEGLSDLAYLNYAGYDAVAVGNHEFDRGTSVFARFIRSATFPVLAANVDVSEDPDLKGLVAPSAIVDVNGERVGVVGAVTEELPTITNTGPHVKMLNLVESCQSAIDRLTGEGVNKIVLLTHVGYDEETELVGKLRGVDVLVGGHSHSYLCSVEREKMPRPEGPYPTQVKGADGAKVYIVQAWQWGMVLGRLTVDFDKDGTVTAVRDAMPVEVTEATQEDPVFAGIVAAFSKPVEAVKNKVVGRTETVLARGADGQTMAMVIADAQLDATRRYGSVAAFINAGGVRAALPVGDVTYGDALSVQPFNNTLVVLELTGAELLAALEHGAEVGGGMLLPSNGTTYSINSEAPVGNRVSEVVVGGTPLDTKTVYRVTVNNFTAGGGDAHTVLKEAKGTRTATGITDIDALLEFFAARSPIKMAETPRISFKKPVLMRLAG